MVQEEGRQGVGMAGTSGASLCLCLDASSLVQTEVLSVPPVMVSTATL